MRWLVLLLITSSAYSWVRVYEKANGGHSVQQTSDGGYVTTGYGWQEYEHQGILFLKVDSLGNEQIRRLFNYRPVNENAPGDMGSCVRQTKDGGYIITGVTCKTDYWGDLLIIKTDENGDSLWSRVYKSVYDDVGNWIEQTKDGGYIVTGQYAGAYLWLLKLDENGDTTWTMKYDEGKTEIGFCVRQTTDNGYAVASSVGLIKTDSLGNIQWKNQYGAACACQTTDGGYVMATSHNKDVWIIKTNGVGDTLWTRTYGGTAEDYGLCVQQTREGGYITVGASWSFSGGWLLKLDTNGDTSWTRIYNSFNTNAGQQTKEGGYILSGMKYDSLFFIKTDSLGFVGISEPPTRPPPHSAWQVVSPIGSTVTLRYANHPQGFHALVFDASGRKVDEIQSQGVSGTITWGKGRSPGVYFVKEKTDHSTIQKVVLIR